SMAQGARPVEEPLVRRTIEIRSPATGARVAEYPIADRDAGAAAVARAREAQARWVALDFVERARILRRVRDAFIDGKERIADVVSGETGKPRHDVFTNELLIVCDGIGFWAKRAARYLADDKARPHLMKTKRAYTSYHPHGVVGVIGPWNFPFSLTIGEAIPALMAGNAVVLKPSEVTPGSALVGCELAEAAGLPPGLLQTVVGYGETGQHLIDLADMICFTGSVETGRKVAARCGQLLKPTTLELGGKDPMIVLVDVTHDMEVMRDETFGPVIPIMRVKDEEEAIRLANDSRYGLDASVWTKDLERGARIARCIQSGAVCVNDVMVNFAVTEVPMGGVKESGVGHRHGPDGLRKYCVKQAVVIDRFGMKSEINWWPITPAKVRLFR